MLAVPGAHDSADLGADVIKLECTTATRGGLGAFRDGLSRTRLLIATNVSLASTYACGFCAAARCAAAWADVLIENYRTGLPSAGWFAARRAQSAPRLLLDFRYAAGIAGAGPGYDFEVSRAGLMSITGRNIRPR